MKASMNLVAIALLSASAVALPIADNAASGLDGYVARAAVSEEAPFAHPKLRLDTSVETAADRPLTPAEISRQRKAALGILRKERRTVDAEKTSSAVSGQPVDRHSAQRDIEFPSLAPEELRQPSDNDPLIRSRGAVVPQEKQSRSEPGDIEIPQFTPEKIRKLQLSSHDPVLKPRGDAMSQEASSTLPDVSVSRRAGVSSIFKILKKVAGKVLGKRLSFEPQEHSVERRVASSAPADVLVDRRHGFTQAELDSILAGIGNHGHRGRSVDHREAFSSPHDLVADHDNES